MDQPQDRRPRDRPVRDVFREIPLRYLGYANELGESFRHMVPLRLVCFSYVISSGYVLSHAVFQGLHANKTDIVALQGTPTQNTSHQNHNTKVSPGIAFLDTLLWQGLASVLIPGMAINRLCAISRTVLNKRAGHLLGSASKKWIVTGIGLAAIPFIIHPIDSFVDKLMESIVSLRSEYQTITK